MDQLTLEVELASVECDKAFMMCEAYSELDENEVFTEEEKKEGLIKKAIEKLKQLIDTVKEWFTKHFKKGETLIMEKSDADKYRKTTRLVRKLKNAVTSPYYWRALAAHVGPAITTATNVHYGHNGNVLSLSTDTKINPLGAIAAAGEFGAGAYRTYRNTGNVKKGKAAPVVKQLKELGVEHIEDDYWAVAKHLDEARKNGKISEAEYLKRMLTLRHALNMCYRMACRSKRKSTTKDIRLGINENGNVQAYENNITKEKVRLSSK